MNFALDTRAEEFRAEVRQVVEENYTEDERRSQHETGSQHSWKLFRALAENDMLGAAWPVEEGGAGRSQHEIDVLYDEASRVGAPMGGYSTTMIVAESLRRIGTPEQRELVLPRVLAGDIVCSIGYTEPGSGSDVAAAKTRARQRDDGSWVINGQKAFTTSAEEASYVFLLTRTNEDVPKHRGLTMFLVPTSVEGFSYSPVNTLGGERTNMTFYDDVVVGDDARVGEIDGGWAVMLIALDFERGGEFAAEMQRLVDLVTTWALEAPESVSPSVLRRIGRLVGHTEAAKLLGAQATSLREDKKPANLEGTMAKLYATEGLQVHSSALLDALGPAGALQEGAPGAPETGAIEEMYRHSIVTTIYGGTSEVLRGVVADRWLKLPRNASKP